MITREIHPELTDREHCLPMLESLADTAPASAKDSYRAFSRGESSLPIFSRDWWLDAVAGKDAWGAALVRKGGLVVAAMPYMLRRQYGLRVVGQPALTPRLGPWIRPREGRPAARLAYEKELMQALIDQLPPFDHFAQNWHYDYVNWMPFAWNGFRQTTRYTYVLSGLADVDRLWWSLQHTTRAECRKAVHRFRLQVRSDLPIDDFIALNRLTFARQRVPVPYPDDLLRRLDAACSARNCGRSFIAVDEEGRRHAGNYVVWDGTSAYCLMAGADPALRTSGAATLCMWEAIRFAAGVAERFDFTGSMIEPIERFLRGFGPTQVAYSNISKTPSHLLRIRQAWRSFRGLA